MKKFGLVLVAFLMTGSVFAQGLDFGIKAGANFASISDATGLSNRTGFQFGIFAGAKLNDNLGIQGDLLYSQQGAEVDPDKIDLNYVNVPVVIKYFVAEGLNIQLGPQFGFIVDDNISEVFGNLVEAESFDLTGVAGIGYDFPMGIRAEARYNFGFTDIIKDSKGKNSVVSLAVGYSFL